MKSAKVRSLLNPTPQLPDRDRWLFCYGLRQQGLTFREIGERIGLDDASAQVLTRKGEAYSKVTPESFMRLSVRAQNVIRNMLPTDFYDISRDEAKRLIGRDAVAAQPNCGHKTFREICEWLDATSPST